MEASIINYHQLLFGLSSMVSISDDEVVDSHYLEPLYQITWLFLGFFLVL